MEMKTLTVNGKTYEITDAKAVSTQPQQLTQEQKLQARHNLGMEEKTYTLIEDITLESDANQITRTTEPDGTPYDFDAIRILVVTPACGGNGTNHQLALQMGAKSNSWYSFFGVRDAIKAAEDRATSFVARNDRGMINFYACTAKASSDSVYSAVYANPLLDGVKQWENINRLVLSTYPSSISMLPGTRIQIYGIRG